MALASVAAQENEEPLPEIDVPSGYMLITIEEARNALIAAEERDIQKERADAYKALVDGVQTDIQEIHEEVRALEVSRNTWRTLGTISVGGMAVLSTIVAIMTVTGVVN